jgi:hypothetical protein
MFDDRWGFCQTPRIGDPIKRPVIGIFGRRDVRNEPNHADYSNNPIEPSSRDKGEHPAIR